MIYKSPRYFLPSFKSIGILIQEKKFKIDFQDGGYSGHLRYSIGTILAFLYQQLTLILPTKFQVNCSLRSREEVQYRFGGHLGFTIGTILAIVPILPTKVWAYWPLSLGDNAKNRFSWWLPSWPSWIFDRNDLQVAPIIYTKFRVKYNFWFRKRSAK